MFDKNVLEDKHKDYQSRIDFKISLDDFCNPSTLIRIHDDLVGTVGTIKKSLENYEHIKYFNYMLFFKRLTAQQIEDGPITTETKDGEIIYL